MAQIGADADVKFCEGGLINEVVRKLFSLAMGTDCSCHLFLQQLE